MVLRWGIVSAGKISHDFVNAFNTYPETKGAVMAAIAARDISRAKEFAKTHNIPKVFDSYKAMAESKDIDVAYIGALNPQHMELICLFLNNGKHVLCEKPLCLNYAQVKKVVDLARQKKLFLMEAVWSRFFPSYIQLEKDINAGKFGDIKFVEANFGVPIDTIDRVIKKDLGGSTLLDLGVYVLQFAQYVFKTEPIKITSVGDKNSEGVDVADTVILEYGNGRRAVLNAHGQVRLNNTACVVGTKGRATLQDPFHCPTQMNYSDGTVFTKPLHDSKLYYNFENSAGLVYEALETQRCIEQGLIESPRMSHNESLLIAKLEDTIRQQMGVVFDVDKK